ncbi:MAG: ComEC/Rec2 family competence protein, partial [Flavobacteriaceae bacterium]|nr:ComEC/Rec2 family competence protein [Flavobacteriaceae bacterium]
MKFLHLTILQLAVAMSLGILLAARFSMAILVLHCLPLIIGALLLVWLLLRRKLNPLPFFEILSMVFFIAIGYVNFQLQQPHFQRNHYSIYISDYNLNVIQLKIKEVLKPSSFQEKYIAEIFQIDSIKTKGKVILQLQKDTIKKPYEVDDIILINSKIITLPEAKNPHQFNYKEYLQHLGVHYQIGATKDSIIASSAGKTTIKGLAEKTRNYLITKLSLTPIQKEEKSIIEALVLGQRQHIDPEIYKAYAAAGAIHILAVSGLHVGIIYFLLSGLLFPLTSLRSGKQMRSILIIILLWGFAFLAGLSPSVVRAVTMFSFFALAGMLNRPTNSFNILFLSYFVLLIYNPNWIFHVGFQLSYLAVFFILWVQPKLYKLYRPKWKIDKLFWDIATVTIAAQLGVAPLSVYYFHQFPGLFFVTNLVILPFLALLLGYGIVVVLLAAFSWLPETMALGYNFLLKTLNQFVQWIAEKDSFLFQNISISFFEMMGFYFLSITLVIWWKQRNRKWIFAFLGSVIFLFTVSLYEKKQVKEELIIFHKPRKTWMAVTSNDSMQLFQKDTLFIEDEYPIKTYAIAKNAKYKAIKNVPNLFTFKK